ncbi:hypothetical protein ACHHV8_16810 [Paenibacillus sp. TAB 01]|uniref:hypothetical protein n=1 Tax=Paenibacillus sp. TAB 01 TaxID=3368988 RepID=UPI003750CE24
MKLEAIYAAIERMEQLETEDNRDMLRSILADYRSMAEQLEHRMSGQPVGSPKKSVRRDLELKAFQAERNEIQSMYENGDIDRNLAGALRIHINYREASVMEAQTVHSE